MSFRPGQTIDERYELGAQLGSGGMARVYLAHDSVLDRQVAVKVLSETYASDPTFVERFRQEASAAAGLSHPNIVAVYDRGASSGSYYIVMEYLSGPDLKQVIRRRAPLAPAEAVDNATQILAALGAAHKRDIIHRDVKPQNVLVAEDGRLKVTDFGIARAGEGTQMTEAGSVIGTAQYLSPEQARGEETTAASDCYAVGIVLYEMLTGLLPFDGGAPVAVAMKQISDPPTPPRVHKPSIPPALERVVLKALEKRPRDRYRTAEEFSDALVALGPVLGQATGQTAVMAAAAAGAATGVTSVMDDGPPTGATRVAPPPAREEEPRSRWPLIVAAVAALAIVGVIAALALTGGGGGSTTVPNVAGLPLAEATSAIRDAGLTPEVERTEDDEIEAGTVIDTDPAAGSSVSEGDTVTLRVSAGPTAVEVPNVVGLERDDARRALAQAGFGVRVDLEGSDDVQEGIVISQSPAAGQEAAAESDVTIVVSSGADQVEVPSLIGRPQSEAGSLLSQAGLSPAVQEQPTTNSPAGTVIDQSPGAGTRIDAGSTVTITVAVAVQTVTVPTVTGLTSSQAFTELQSSGFNPVSATAPSDTVPEGIVISQSPGGGSEAEEGATVEIVVSTGPTSTSGSDDGSGGGSDDGSGGGSDDGSPLP
ncbi:MAG: Stk1 family PASTA domain-containing Ser/Thr kinase [Miltoncostaeaceae bacterium]